MTLRILNIALFLCSFSKLQGQESDFYINQVFCNADLVEDEFNRIDDRPLDSLDIDDFIMNGGGYTVYCFIRRMVCESKDSLRTVDFGMEYILVKVKGKRILESYYLPFSWREPPISNVVLRSRKNRKISRRVCTKYIRFVPVREDGINILKDGYLVFKDHD